MSGRDELISAAVEVVVGIDGYDGARADEAVVVAQHQAGPGKLAGAGLASQPARGQLEIPNAASFLTSDELGTGLAPFLKRVVNNIPDAELVKRAAIVAEIITVAPDGLRIAASVIAAGTGPLVVVVVVSAAAGLQKYKMFNLLIRLKEYILRVHLHC